MKRFLFATTLTNVKWERVLTGRDGERNFALVKLLNYFVGTQLGVLVGSVTAASFVGMISIQVA